MQTSEIKQGAKLIGTTAVGNAFTGIVQTVDTSGKRGAFVELHDGTTSKRFRPSQLKLA